MTELLTAAQMRAIEQAAIDSGKVTGLEMMERAGRGVVEAIFEEWPELAKSSHKAVVLCGPGNNGGDGFVVARLLKEWGWEVEVFLYGAPEKLPPDARVNYERWTKLGGVADLFNFFIDGRGMPDVVLDAVFGTGLRRPVSLGEPYRDAVSHEPESGLKGNRKHVAIDIPSGLCADSGRILGDPVLADLTVTFHRPKIGQYIEMGPALCGRVVQKDIGITGSIGAHDYFREIVLPAMGLHSRYDSFEKLRKPQFKTVPVDPHKFSHGHALILSGGPGTTGAARLAARGALRIGAGLVTLGVPPSAQQECASHLTSIMLSRIPDAAALEDALQDVRLTALCLGPGMGLGEREASLVATALAAKRPTVLDADALTLIARDSGLFAALHPECVLTPHAGEFARLFPDIAKRLDEKPMSGPAFSKVDAAREAAARAGCTVLFKGPDTVIADQDGRCSLNASVYERAAPWLATAGSGDVLAGFITGLLARGFSPHEAASTGAWLHTECALSFGPGLIAEDLPEELPKVFRHLGV